uniref:Nebulette n=1 Tax=Oreochromis niloticus TaxID=8128 RepID=A0A669AUY9_ORENI
MRRSYKVCSEGWLLHDFTYRGANCVFQAKYKKASKKETSASLYHRLPETLETQHAKEASQLQSQKFYKEKYNREKGKSSYTNMKTLPEVEHAMEVNKKQSEVNIYRKGKEELHHYNAVPDRPDIVNATNAAKLASDLASKMFSINVYLALLQVKYKESFDRQLKGQKPQYNPLECVSFKQTQAASALASQVKYKTNQNQKPEGSSDLPNLLQLEHALHASKLQSNVEYKKKYEQTKAHYHIALDTAEQLHHKENAVLHSQVKYREEYEKNKGRSLMEFGDTQTYKVSKEAQKMQSEKEYRKDYEEQMKGKALVDVDQTPGYLTARHASSLLSEVTYIKLKKKSYSFSVSLFLLFFALSLQKEYKRDLEQEVKGRGLSGVGLEETPELLRVRKANQILNQKEYRRDLEREIVGKGMELSADVLEMQRAKRASQIQSQQLREHSYGTVTDTPELLHASYLKDVYSQKKYKDEAERLKGRYSLVSETPEMERVKANQRHISSVSYREEVGCGTAVMDTPEMERVRRNQENISSVSTQTLIKQNNHTFKECLKNTLNTGWSQLKATSVGVTPELERVKQNQENISSRVNLNHTNFLFTTTTLKLLLQLLAEIRGF